MRRPIRSIALATLLVACGGEAPAPSTSPPATPAPPAAITAAGSTQLEGVVGAVTEPVASVADAQGRPLAGIAVTFEVVAGQGTVSERVARTDASGQATTRWTLGPQAGEQRIVAVIDSLPAVTWRATVRPGTTALLVLERGAQQTAPAGTRLPIDPTIVAQDRQGNPLPGVTVTFVPDTASGTVATQQVTTDGSGRALAAWTIGVRSGAQRLVARVVRSGEPPLEIAIPARAVAGSPVAIVPGWTDTPDGLVGEPLERRAAVVVLDAHDNPVPGAPVRFTVLRGGGHVDQPQQLTDGHGRAQATWTMGDVAGEQELQAQVGARTPVRFAARAARSRAARVARLEPAQGHEQVAPAGTTLPVEPRVIARDRFGNVVRGVAIEFAVTRGGGGVGRASAVTDSTGRAGTPWTLGPGIGDHLLVAAATDVPGVTFEFRARALAGAPARIDIVSGDGQTGPVGVSLPLELQLRVLDAAANPVANSEVRVDAGDLAGAPPVITLRTGSDGTARTPWVLAHRAGSQELRITTGELPPVTARATAQPGSATAVAMAGGNGQTADVGQLLPQPIRIVARDRFENPVPGIVVTFSAGGTNGTVSPTTATTDATGIASTSWRLGGTAGPQRLTASVDGQPSLGTIGFDAIARAGVPITHVVHAGNGQTATAGTAVPTRPATRIRDANGNPVAGIAVTFAVVSGGGTVTAAATTTDAMGVATVGSWTLGGTVGTQTLAARAAGLPEASVNATATAPAGGTITIVAGNGQVAAAGATVALAPSVVVRDAANQPVPNAVVTFSVTGGGGTVAPTSVTTNVSGVATVTSWRLGPAAGPNTLVASRTGFASATFTATALVGGQPVLERTVVMSGLSSPWDLAFTPDSALLLTERAGRLRVRLWNGTTRLLYQPPDIRAQDQGGLLGVAVDPQFASNRFVYLFLSINVAGRVENRVRRVHVPAGYTTVDSPVDIVDSIPWGNGGAHNGGRIRFGADGMLYVGSGDNRSGLLPQRVDRLAGKVLRVTRDGATPAGNPTGWGPTAHPSLWAIGFRNVQGLAVRPSNGQLFSCEHGPGHSDEVTRLAGGGNGGWDPMTAPDTTYRGYDGGRSMTDLAKFPSALRPTWSTGGSSFGMSGCVFVSGPQWLDWDGAMIVALLSGRRAEVLRLNADGTSATNTPILSLGDRLRAVALGPDGSLWVLTDGKSGGDELWRVVPR